MPSLIIDESDPNHEAEEALWRLANLGDRRPKVIIKIIDKPQPDINNPL